MANVEKEREREREREAAIAKCRSLNFGSVQTLAILLLEKAVPKFASN